jgi:hypothetical protein
MEDGNFEMPGMQFYVSVGWLQPYCLVPSEYIVFTCYCSRPRLLIWQFYVSVWWLQPYCLVPSEYIVCKWNVTKFLQRAIQLNTVFSIYRFTELRGEIVNVLCLWYYLPW